MSSAQLSIQELSKLAPAVVEDMYERFGREWSCFGESGKAKCLEDTAHFLSFLGQALEVDEPALFLHFVDWLKLPFAAANLPADLFPKIATTAAGTIRQRYVAPDAARAVALLDEGVRRHYERTAPEPCHLNPNAPYYELATSYLTMLLRYEREHASALILQNAARGTTVQDLYGFVFEPCLRELGRLWQSRSISVAQEHYGTSATQLIMSLLHPYIFEGKPRLRTTIAVCVGGELHEVGVRMVADMFEMAGWNSHYFGANTPLESTLKAVEDLKPEVICISATLTYHVSRVRELIVALRQEEAARRSIILVGGYPFRVAPHLWLKVGADGTATSAVEAVSVGERLASAMVH